jgi:hypothetical protein
LIKCFLILIAVLNVTPTMAAGAVALASPDDIAHGGVAIGIQVNLLVEDDAKRYAMSECELEKTQNSVRVPCMIVATFHNQCAAFAIDFWMGDCTKKGRRNRPSFEILPEHGRRAQRLL